MRNLITKLSVTAFALVAVVGAGLVPVAASAATPDLAALRAAMQRPVVLPQTKTVCHIVPANNPARPLAYTRVCEEVRIQRCRVVPVYQAGKPLPTSFNRVCE